MSGFKSILNNFFLFFLIILNILDFIELLPSDMDLIKKLISWSLMIYLLYHLGFTKIIIGYQNKTIDFVFLFSYLLNISKDLFFYIFNVKSSMHFFEGFVIFIKNYESQVSFYSFNISLILMLLISIYIVFKLKINEESMLGALSLHKQNKVIRFFGILLSVSFVYYFIFNIIFQWFTIVIDAPLIMIALVYYIFAATRYHSSGSILHNVGSFGDRLTTSFIEFFHKKKTLPLGIISILILHFFTDIIVFVLPTLVHIKDHLFFNVMVGNFDLTIFQLFVQNINGLDIYGILNLSFIYLSNICFISFCYFSHVNPLS